LKEQQQASIDDLHKYRGHDVNSMNRVQKKTQTEQTAPRAIAFTSTGLSEMDQFIVQQRQISKEWKKQQLDSASYLHSYRGIAAPSEEPCSTVTPTNYGSTVESVLETPVSDITQTIERHNTLTTTMSSPSPKSTQGERIIAVVASAYTPNDADEPLVDVSFTHSDDISPKNLMKNPEEMNKVMWIPPEIDSNCFPAIVNVECPSGLEDCTEAMDLAITLHDTVGIDNEEPLFSEIHIKCTKCSPEVDLIKGEDFFDLTQSCGSDIAASENLRESIHQRFPILQDIKVDTDDAESLFVTEKSRELEKPALAVLINSVACAQEEHLKLEINPSGICTEGTRQTPTGEREHAINKISSDNIIVNTNQGKESTVSTEIVETKDTSDIAKVETEYLSNIHNEQSEIFAPEYGSDGTNGLFMLMSTTTHDSSDQMVVEEISQGRVDAIIVTPPKFEKITRYHRNESMPVVEIQERDSHIQELKATSLNGIAVYQRAEKVHITRPKDETNSAGSCVYIDSCKSVQTDFATGLTHRDEKEPMVSTIFCTNESHITLSASSPLSTPCTKKPKFTSPTICERAKATQSPGSLAKQSTRCISTTTSSSRLFSRTPVSGESLTKSVTSLKLSSCKQSPRLIVQPYRRTLFHQSMKINDLICCQKWVPTLHLSRAGCEWCLFHASSKEKSKFETEGRHIMIFLTKGGCSRDCNTFPRRNDEEPARLCRKCFHDTHRFGKA
jgi:hypothetical protein